jgi:hypothetical protein
LYVNVQAGVQAVFGLLQRQYKCLETAGLVKMRHSGNHGRDRANLAASVCGGLRFIALKILSVNAMTESESCACASCVCRPDLTGR